MPLTLEPYLAQSARWPRSGQQVMAQFDADSVVVYQAFQPRIGTFAAAHGYFGGDFSLNRMSWIKPNFLWMMYRSGWGTKPGQEITLSVRMRRAAFDAILADATHAAFVAGAYPDHASWRGALAESDVRLQWDPDHDPQGAPLERRAVQLGLRGSVLTAYASEWILEVEDISSFVAEQRAYAHAPYADLVTPSERLYPVADASVARRLGVPNQG